MNQTIGAYLDCFMFILLGGLMLTLGPSLMQKSGRGANLLKLIKMVRICGVLVLLAGLCLLAMRFLSKS
jgi:hypothetical protein